jgi:hypothetical protein
MEPKIHNLKLINVGWFKCYVVSQWGISIFMEVGEVLSWVTNEFKEAYDRKHLKKNEENM